MFMFIALQGVQKKLSFRKRNQAAKSKFFFWDIL